MMAVAGRFNEAGLSFFGSMAMIQRKDRALIEFNRDKFYFMGRKA